MIMFSTFLGLSNASTYQLDLSSLQKVRQQAVIQTFTFNRISVSNSQLFISMNPTDGDGLTDMSRNNHRQRNEISVNIDRCVSQNNKPITYKARIQMMDNIKWLVTGNSWYHIFQIKKYGRDRPLITIGIKNGKLVLYHCDGFTPIVVGNINKYWNQWLYLTAQIVPSTKNIKINYSFAGKSGQMICIKNINTKHKLIYMKLGQYRYYPNTIKSISKTAYKNIMCVE